MAKTKTAVTKQKKEKVVETKPILNPDALNIVVGWDVSSTTIGWGALYFLGNKIHQVEYGYYKPEEKDNKLLSLVLVKQHVADILENAFHKNIKGQYGLVTMYSGVEDFLLHMEAKSSANTITMLSVYNRTVCMSVFDFLAAANEECVAFKDNIPRLLPVATIRSILRKLSGQEERVDKEHVPDVVEEIINSKWYDSSSAWTFRRLTKRTGKMQDECFDMADGLAVAVATANKLGLL